MTSSLARNGPASADAERLRPLRADKDRNFRPRYPQAPHVSSLAPPISLPGSCRWQQSSAVCRGGKTGPIFARDKRNVGSFDRDETTRPAKRGTKGERGNGCRIILTTDRSVRAGDQLSARIGDRPLRFPLRLLHGGGHDLPAEDGAAVARGARPAVHGLRRAAASGSSASPAASRWCARTS